MPDTLDQLLRDQADGLAPAHFDADQIAAAGRRRIRRRGLAMGSGLAALGLAAGALVTQLLGGHAASTPVATDGTSALPKSLSWAAGTWIHVIDATSGRSSIVETQKPIRSYVNVGSGFAYIATDRSVNLVLGEREWAVDVNARINRNDGAELISDGDQFAYLTSDSVVTRVDADPTLPTVATPVPGAREMTAMDHGTVWVATDQGNVRVDLDAASHQGVVTSVPRRVLDQEGAVQVSVGSGPDRQVSVITGPSGRVEVPGSEEIANLSPDGHFVTTTINDVGYVRDTATGNELPFSHGHEWGMGYQWLDQDTLAVMAFDGVASEDTAMGRLVTCDFPRGVCHDKVDLPSGFGSFQLPLGSHFGS